MVSSPCPADETQNERTPLLDASQQDGDSSSPSALSSWTPKQWRVMVLGAILLLALDFGSYLGTPPQIEIFEDIICRGYYAKLNQTSSGTTTLLHPLDDAICKVAPVQSELALVNGWKGTFDVLPSILTGLPYGVLADHIGRRPVLVLAVLGSVLGEIWPRIVCWFGMPLRLVWLSGLWRVIGGGDLVTTSMVLVIVADLFSEEERATALFRLSSAALVAEIVATPISAVMMSTDPWLPYLVGLAIILIFFPLLFLVPETIEEAREKARKTLATGDHHLPEALEPPSKGTLFATIYSRVQTFLQSTQFMWRNSNVLLTLLAVFVGILSKQSTSLLLQYASAKYHWSIARASFLISLRGSISIASYLLLVPVISSFLIRYLHLEAVSKDLYVAQASAAFAIAGFLVIFVAETPPVLILGVVLVSLGIPFGMSVLSVATSLVPSDHVATLYSAASVMHSVGMLVAGPIFASVYGFGIRLGLSWSGLPFGLASLTFVLALIAVSCVRAGRRPGNVAGDY